MNFSFKTFIYRNEEYYQTTIESPNGESRYCVTNPIAPYMFKPFDFYINESNMSIIRMVLTEKKWKQK